MSPLVLFALSAIFAAVSARLVISYSSRLGVRRQPDDRSLHEGNIPHAGGLGIVLAGTLSFGPLSAGNPDLLVIGILALCLGALGLMDDMRHLTRLLRLVVQTCACFALLYYFSPLPIPDIAAALPQVVWFSVTLVAAVWWVNLFNFMDGLDGLAASEAIFILGTASAAVAILTSWSLSPVMIWMLVLACACLGFLYYNWPPAKIFMGDTASLYLPFAIFSVAHITIDNGVLSHAFWFILVAVFVTDATITLLVRIATGQKWMTAHRTHAYQKLTLKCEGRHLPALLLYSAINLFWLLPLAVAAIRWREYEWWLTAVAYLPIAAFVVACRAGYPEYLESTALKNSSR